MISAHWIQFLATARRKIEIVVEHTKVDFSPSKILVWSLKSSRSWGEVLFLVQKSLALTGLNNLQNAHLN